MALILLVDDEQLITNSLTYSLKREGFDVANVADGISAIKAVEELNPDLIVLDLMLPDISGFEVCRRLRTFTATPVIMLTARGEEIDRVLGLEVGADDYLAKPFSFASFWHASRRCSEEFSSTARSPNLSRSPPIS